MAICHTRALQEPQIWYSDNSSHEQDGSQPAVKHSQLSGRAMHECGVFEGMGCTQQRAM